MFDDDHELHFNPQRAVPDFAACGLRRDPANAAALSTLRRVELRYGDHPLHTLDLFPAQAGGPAPVHVFIHGGYWRAQDKANFAYVAAPLVERGITAAILNYELCPDSTLDGVAESAIAGVAWLHANVAAHGGDPSRIGLSGHSAGAHLCAEVLAVDWAAQGVAAPFLTGAVLISGIYDPAPALHTTVNEQLRLTPAIIARRDVERRPPQVTVPTWLFAGGREPWRWIEQTFRYSHHLRRHGADPAVQVLPGRHHFDIIDGYADPGSSILRAVLASVGTLG